MENISYFFENIDFQIKTPRKYTTWINQLISEHKKVSGEITYVFCSDEYLIKLNVEHLNHDTFTDIITFDYTTTGIISGDIFISIDRIKENSKEFKVSFEEELNRVMSHGILHLIGFKDKSDEEKKQMREAENNAISLSKSILN